MKLNSQIVLLLYISGLCWADVSAQQATAHDSRSDVPKGNVTLVSLFKPVYPPLARQADISGEVEIAVKVRPDGTTEATLESGHPMLIQAALDSARQSRFECRMCSTPLSYTLVYEFKQIEGPDCCSAFSAPIMVEQATPSADEQGRLQTRITIAAEHVCLCDPASTLTPTKVRSIKCLYLWKCSALK